MDDSVKLWLATMPTDSRMPRRLARPSLLPMRLNLMVIAECFSMVGNGGGVGKTGDLRLNDERSPR
jgi:hypothetical protein